MLAIELDMESDLLWVSVYVCELICVDVEVGDADDGADDDDMDEVVRNSEKFVDSTGDKFDMLCNSNYYKDKFMAINTLVIRLLE